MEKLFTRRRLLITGALGTAAAAAGGFAITKRKGLWLGSLKNNEDNNANAEPAPRIFDFRTSQLSGPPPLAIVTGPSPSALAREAIKALGGMGEFVRKGEKVLIKPNVGWDRVPEQAANTNPEVVAALCEMCFEAGASKVIVSDVTCNEIHRSFDSSGIGAAARKAGASVIFPRDAYLKEIDFSGEVIRSWPVYTHFLEVDRIINVPIAKHHTLATLTLGMKNWFGVIGGLKNRLHQNIHNSIADLSTSIRPTLTVIDAFRILLRNGPQGGDLKDVKLAKTLIASPDPVAADSVAASLFGIDGESLEYLRIAHARGLGELKRQMISIKEIVAHS